VETGSQARDDRPWGFATRAVHAGAVPDSATGARAVPIYQSTSFVFTDTADAANLFALQKYGNIYSRMANPTVAAFEERVASLEGALGAVATSSGQAAEFLTFACLAGSGDHVVSAASLYGGTVTQLDVTLRRFGVDTTFVAGDDAEAFRAAITDRTRFVFAEMVTNPSGEVTDVAALADVAHDAGIPLIIDATTASPYLCRPMEHGADIVIHSATKFLGGHGTTLGGVVCESGRFPWGNGRFPQMTEPIPSYGNLTWWGNFQEYGFLTKLRSEQLRDIGATLSPHSAFLLLQGVETLPQRMRAHVANARRVAEWLDADDRVDWVRYAGLPDHPHHARAQRYLPEGPGSVFAFGVRGRGERSDGGDSGRDAGRRFIESVQLCSHLANIGDARTLVLHPASTTHQQLSEDQLREGGVRPDLIRISVGIEDVEDILWDLDQALTAATKDA
jgi:O-acetylhomoserine (thiol)-lyase